MTPYALSRADILRLLHALNDELKAANVKGQVNLAGGAVMCLAFGARPSTRDVDATVAAWSAIVRRGRPTVRSLRRRPRPLRLRLR